MKREIDGCVTCKMEERLDQELRFAGSPKNKYGTHSSKGFKGDYEAAWRCHFSKVGNGSINPKAYGPIMGTVRRVAMIAAAMEPECQLIEGDSVGPRQGPKSPLNCSFASSPSDYGFSTWADPSDDDLTQEDIQLTCKDLNVIKKCAMAEIKRRIKDREEEEEKKKKGVNAKLEMRAFPVELRIEGEEEHKIVGHAAIFNKLSDDLGGFRERILPGAFTRALEESDVRALWNHDSNIVLGRMKAGTLRLEEDNKGLRVEIDPPSWATPYLETIKRGDVTEMSFAFTVASEEWDDKKKERNIKEIDRLFDVSPVTYPAYPQTSVKVRMDDTDKEEIIEGIGRYFEHPKDLDIQGADDKERGRVDSLDIKRKRLEIAEHE